VVKRYNSAGTLLGSTSYNSPGNGIGNGNGTDTPDFVAIASDGDVVVVGSDTHNEPTRAALQGMDWLIMKYSPNLMSLA
jgi:hypothetical protein